MKSRNPTGMEAQTGRNKESRTIGMIRLRDSANIYRPGLGTVSNYVTQRKKKLVCERPKVISHRSERLAQRLVIYFSLFFPLLFHTQVFDNFDRRTNKRIFQIFQISTVNLMRFSIFPPKCFLRFSRWYKREEKKHVSKMLPFPVPSETTEV